MLLVYTPKKGQRIETVIKEMIERTDPAVKNNVYVTHNSVPLVVPYYAREVPGIRERILARYKKRLMELQSTDVKPGRRR